MSAGFIAFLLYVVVGLSFALYIGIYHFVSLWQYIKQLYTARYLTPTEIKTYFGFNFWWDRDCDSWIEISIMSLLRTLLLMFISIFIWPICIFFVLNMSIERARKRLEN